MTELLESHRSHETALSGLTVHRALPVRGRRMVGPWCFLDRFGPVTFADGKAMEVGAHPHIGIQTVSWLLEGEIVHHDSLGHEALLKPDGVNIMTAGRGIAHAEETPARNSGHLSGVQLWVALPDEHRHREASFQNVPRVPSLILPGGLVQVFAGEIKGVASPAVAFSSLVGADVTVHGGEALTIPLRPDFEYGFFLESGAASLLDQPLEERTLYYLAPGRTEAHFRGAPFEGARLLLVGGPPFGERILMWWNFVGRRRDEIRQARSDWAEHRRFGDIPGFSGSRIEAPELMALAEPGPAAGSARL